MYCTDMMGLCGSYNPCPRKARFVSEIRVKNARPKSESKSEYLKKEPAIKSDSKVRSFTPTR